MREEQILWQARTVIMHAGLSNYPMAQLDIAVLSNMISNIAVGVDIVKIWYHYPGEWKHSIGSSLNFTEINANHH